MNPVNHKVFLKSRLRMGVINCGHTSLNDGILYLFRTAVINDV